MINKWKRPKIIINCAMSVDGKIALPNRKQIRISSEEDIKRVHNLRNICDAVLVGVGSVLSDNPKLTVKDKYVTKTKQPIRIVLDSHCKTPVDALVVNEKAKTYICCAKEHDKEKLFKDNVEKIICKTDKKNFIDLKDLIKKLAKKKIKLILVEGGGTIIWSFLKERLVDDFYVFLSPIIIGGKSTPTVADGDGIQFADDAIRLCIRKVESFKDGVLIHYQF